MPKSADGWMRAYKKEGALWFHDGNMKRPHVKLTSGKHSDGFFSSKLITRDLKLLEEAAADLVLLLQMRNFNIEIVDRVVGAPTGGTRLAESVADWISNIRERKCQFATLEKSGEGEGRKMVFGDTRVIPGEFVLLCEDTITTGRSLRLTERAIEEQGGNILPFVLALANRSELEFVGQRRIITLFKHPMPTWTENMCPLCALGSEAIFPKEGNNWARLNATY